MADYKEYIVRVYTNGNKYWNQNGKLHREDGPAIEEVNGTGWYQKGVAHREDGPAIDWKKGEKYWYQKGKLHREDGPAIEKVNGNKSWYIKGEKLSEQEFLNRNKKEFSMDEIAAALGVPVGELKIRKD